MLSFAALVLELECRELFEILWARRFCGRSVKMHAMIGGAASSMAAAKRKVRLVSRILNFPPDTKIKVNPAWSAQYNELISHPTRTLPERKTTWRSWVGRTGCWWTQSTPCSTPMDPRRPSLLITPQRLPALKTQGIFRTCDCLTVALSLLLPLFGSSLRCCMPLLLNCEIDLYDGT